MSKGCVRRAAIASVILCLLGAMSPAVAGTIYRCDGGDGVPHYVNKRVKGAACTVVSTYRSPSRQAARTAARATTPVTASASPAPRNVNSGAPATFMGGGATAAAAAPAAATTVASAPAAVQRPATTTAKASEVPRRRQGEVYSYVKDGVRHYASARPAGHDVSELRTIRYSYIEACYACGTSPGVNFGSVRLNTTAYANEVAAAARKFGVEEAVVRAIMHAESAFNPNALSRAGAQGLMQLMPATASRFGVVNAFDPVQNIHGGVEYLAWLLKRFNGDLTLAAAGYNAGEGAVDRHKGVPPYRETQRYVERVGVLAQRYRGQVAAN